MADNDTVDRIRAALDDADRVAGDRIDVDLDDGEIVLRGSVATAEDATAAALVADEHADDRVRNELRVDDHLREGPHTGDEGARGYAPEAAGAAPPRGTGPPDAPDGGMVGDTAHALGENEPWDPPDQPHTAPSAAEQRGETDRDVSEPPAAEAGPVDDADEVTPSAPDLSAEELARSAGGQGASPGRRAPGDPHAGREER